MGTFLRCLKDNRGLWPVWLPLLVLAAVSPPLVFALPLVQKQLIDVVVVPLRLDLLPSTMAMYGGLWLLSTAVQIVATALRSYLGEQLTLRLQQRLFAHCDRLSVAFSQREHSARTMALFMNDTPSVAALFTSTVIGGVGSIVALAVGVTLMFSLSWQLALVAGIMPPLVGGLAMLVTRPLRPATRQAQEKAAELSERLQENLAGIREVVAFGRERSQSVSFANTLLDLMRLRMRVTVMDTALQTGQSVFSLTVTLVILGFGSYLVIQGQTTLGTLIAMHSLFGYAFQPAVQIFGLISGAQKALASADRVYAFLDESPRVQDHAGARAPERVTGRVTFDRVSFAYRPGRPVLQNVSFTAEPGQVVALVGPSGAGKTTLASLIARFYDPTSGHVLLDGVDLRAITLAGMRGHIGIVFQDTFLFASTIRENIAFGRESATESEVVAAARAANAWEFVERFPDGLDTLVGQRGIELSEGQKQRIAIARALLRNPRILILDEPTSALDARSEHLVRSALDSAMRGRTTFIVAHRLATVQRADRILVLEAGQIVEQGTHAELLQRQGTYSELYELQFGSAVKAARDQDDLKLANDTSRFASLVPGLSTGRLIRN